MLALSPSPRTREPTRAGDRNGSDGTPGGRLDRACQDDDVWGGRARHWLKDARVMGGRSGRQDSLSADGAAGSSTTAGWPVFG